MTKRSDRVPLPPAMGSTSRSGRSFGLSGPAAAPITSSNVRAVTLSSTDSPLESRNVRSVRSIPALRN
ncbi:Uncharacterised protein [Mycobacteroides abscessus subsp. abscessus]|nr:Uncharacterised protein [Mycobacteroides abscessus subsp. abscessus]